MNLNATGLLINLRALNGISFNAQRTEATVGGGAIISEVINAAYSNNAQVTTGNCNCVGALGAILGGGYGNLMGLNGFGVDLLLSLNVVMPNGEFRTVTSDDADLWWALRGAAPNFGIVTSAVMKATPVPRNESTAWFGGLTFTEDKLEILVQAINDLVLEPKMVIFLYYRTSYGTSGAANYTSEILAAPVYLGSEADAKKAFAPIYAIGPSSDASHHLPYTQWNTGANWFCVKGGRKPSYGAGFQNMVPETWRAIWNEYKEFIKNPGTGNSIVLMEAYSLRKARSVPAKSASFANREVNFNAVAIAWYNDSNLDVKAEAFGTRARHLLRMTDGLASNKA